MLFPHFMKILANLCIKSDSCVIVNCKFLLTGVLTFNDHSPSIKKLCFSKIIVGFEQVNWINLIFSTSPTKTSRKVVSCSQGQYCCRRVDIRPFRNRLDIIQYAANRSITSCDYEENVRHFDEKFQL